MASMELRKSINTPTRYDDEFNGSTQAKPVKPTKPAFPDILQNTIIPFDANARPAAFPSKSLGSLEFDDIVGVCYNQSKQRCDKGLNTDKPSLDDTLPTLKYSSQDESPFVDEGEDFIKLSARQQQYHTLACADTQRQDYSELDELDECDERCVEWHMLCPHMQVYLFSDLLIQLSTPEAVSGWLGLDSQELETVQRAHQIRQVYPATTDQLWDYCVAFNNLSGANYADPKLLKQLLDYYAYASQYEYASRDQIILARTFLKQHHIDPLILDESLRCDGIWARPDVSSHHSGNLEDYPTPPRITEQYAQLDNQAWVSQSSPTISTSSASFTRSNELTCFKRVHKKYDTLPPTQISKLGIVKSGKCSTGKSEQLHTSGNFAAYFKCPYFPPVERHRLLRKPPSLMTDFEYWLVFGAGDDVVLSYPFSLEATSYDSIRGLISLHNEWSAFKTDNTTMVRLSLRFFEDLACLWLYLIYTGMAMTTQVWNRVMNLSLTNQETKSYQQALGICVRQLLIRIYERRRQSSLLSVKREVYSHLSNQKHGTDPNSIKEALRRQPEAKTRLDLTSLNLPKTADPGMLSGFCLAPTLTDDCDPINKMLSSNDARERSDTVSTNATLDMTGQRIKYYRPSIDQQGSRTLGQELRPSEALIDAAFRDTDKITSSNESTIVRQFEQQSSLVGPDYSPISEDQISPERNQVAKRPRSTYPSISPDLPSTVKARRKTPWKVRPDESSSDFDIAKEHGQNKDLETPEDEYSRPKSGRRFDPTQSQPAFDNAAATPRSQSFPSSIPKPHSSQKSLFTPLIAASVQGATKAGNIKEKQPKHTLVGQDKAQRPLKPVDNDTISSEGTKVTKPGNSRGWKQTQEQKGSSFSTETNIKSIEKSRTLAAPQKDRIKKRKPYMTKKRREEMRLAEERANDSIDD